MSIVSELQKSIMPELKPAHKLVVEKLLSHVKTPTKAHPTDLGIDLYCPRDVILEPGVNKINLQIRLHLPTGFGALLRDRSSMASKGIFIVGGVIDENYRGDIIAVFFNSNTESIRFLEGDKVAQLLLLPTYSVNIIEGAISIDTDRGTGGFGSSGK